MIPLSLYIHFPWCIRKCPYCDFNSHQASVEVDEAQYIQALLCDLNYAYADCGARPIHSIFMGGGTPSLFSAQAIEILLENIAKKYPLSSSCEITLEANPGTLEQKKFQEFKLAGINRLSVGIQSLNPKHLKTLGRIHDDEEARHTLKWLRESAFSNWNCDVMYGLPNQTVDEAVADLEQVLRFSPPHFSWYQLTIEPNTYFTKFPPALPKEEIFLKMEEGGRKILQQRGYHRYEISAYAQKGSACQHNLNYWQFGDYIGIGAGAHGKVTKNHNKIYRTQKFALPKRYLSIYQEDCATPNLKKNPFLAKIEEVTPSDMVFEFMLNSLRLMQEIPFDLFESRTGLHRNLITAKLHEARDAGWLSVGNTGWQLTQLGQAFVNNIVELFLTSS